MKTDWAVEVEGLKKSFGYYPVLIGLSFKIPKGEHLVILGRNGCGKTTLLNIMATLLPLNQGKIKIEGLDIKKQALEVRRKLGVIAHASMLYNGLTITENLHYYGRMYGIPSCEKRTAELISRLELGKWEHRKVSELSRGILQRTGIARALIHGPSVLLLDEPESGLDPHALELLVNILDEMKTQGCTIISTSHTLEFALKTSSRLAILDKGRFVHESTTKEINLLSLKETFSQYSDIKHETVS